MLILAHKEDNQNNVKQGLILGEMAMSRTIVIRTGALKSGIN